MLLIYLYTVQYNYTSHGITHTNKQIVCYEISLCMIVYFTVKDDEGSEQFTGDGSVNFRREPALKKGTGNWRACPFILGMILHFSHVLIK